MNRDELILPDLSHLPDDFVWGVATSAFQIEGAADRRGDSIWDTFCAKSGTIADGSDGLTACGHVDQLESDLDLIASLGVSAYRFSIAWPRVQPDGQGAYSADGLEFYERLIEGLLARGIAPYATLYHWDLPQSLQTDHGGWIGRETAKRFADYADTVSRRFGDRVVSFATLNEPWVVAVLGYEQGVFAPGFRSRAAAMQASHHLLVGHGLALQAIRANCKAEAGIVLNMSPIHPLTDSQSDRDKAIIDDGLINRWYMDALYHGRYPADVLSHLGPDAPHQLSGDANLVSQPIDFVGVNYYTRSFASTGEPWSAERAGAAVTDMGWEIYPAGLTELLVRLAKDWNSPRLLVTENGAAFADQCIDGAVDDHPRIEYLATHLAAVDDAVRQGVNVGGYFVWSLLDNFEWASGYRKRFGIVHVDYDTLVRTPKRSAQWYAALLERQSTARAAQQSQRGQI